MFLFCALLQLKYLVSLRISLISCSWSSVRFFFSASEINFPVDVDCCGNPWTAISIIIPPSLLQLLLNDWLESNLLKYSLFDFLVELSLLLNFLVVLAHEKWWKFPHLTDDYPSSHFLSPFIPPPLSTHHPNNYSHPLLSHSSHFPTSSTTSKPCLFCLHYSTTFTIITIYILLDIIAL